MARWVAVDPGLNGKAWVFDNLADALSKAKEFMDREYPEPDETYEDSSDLVVDHVCMEGDHGVELGLDTGGRCTYAAPFPSLEGEVIRVFDTKGAESGNSVEAWQDFTEVSM